MENGSEVKDKTTEKKGKGDSSTAAEEEEENSSSNEEQQDKSEDKDEENQSEVNGEEDEEDIPLSDLSDDEREDVIPHQRLTINNSAAINSSLKRISFITPATPFSEHNSLVSSHPIDVQDPHDDLNRELAFYKVCHDAATTARGLLKKEGIPFTRPGDYFAEMVKTDEHMGRIKKKLFDEAAAKKASADARKQRDLKKFGKQVQVAKLQQRQKEKRETLDKIDALKKSEFPLPLPAFMYNSLTSQNANTTPPARQMTQKASSTSRSTTPANKILANAARARTPSARRRTRGSASVARSAMRRAATPCPVLICGISR